MSMRWLLSIVGMPALYCAVSTQAGSLQTRFTKVTVQDLPIGRWTKVELPSGERYSVENTSDQAVDVKVEAVKPFLEARKLKPYEPIPDPAWVTVSPEVIPVAAGGTGEAEVTLEVPDDPSLANRSFEVWLLAKTLRGQFAVGLITRVRFNTVLGTELSPTNTNTETRETLPSP